LGQHRTDGRAVFRQEAFLDSNTLAHTIVDIVEEKQAMDIVLLDVREQTSIADYFVIATVDNERQARAIEAEMLQNLKVEQNIRPLSFEGVGETEVGGWALLDYGDVIVHLFTEETRRFYNLEELWNKANVVVKVL
jgi:ribosome-associated protein